MKIFKVFVVVVAWLAISLFIPPLGLIILMLGLFLGLPVFVIFKFIKKDNPTLFKPIDHGQILQAIILDAKSNAKTGNTVGRAIIGNAIAGDAGAIVGAMTSKRQSVTDFLVIYEDDYRETITVDNNSQMYNKLIYYVKLK
ncbi:MAG: hypothetical protein RR848_04405 [Oscillospiraceae bacterium]